MRGSRGGEIGLWWILRRDLVVQDFGSAGDWNECGGLERPKYGDEDRMGRGRGL